MDPLVTKERSTEPRRNAVLVVEDDFLARWGVSEYLRETGFYVIEAINASEALAAIHADPAIDVIFCAIGTTTGVGGEDFLRLVAKERPSLPVLIASDGSHRDRTLDLPNGARIEINQLFSQPENMMAAVKHSGYTSYKDSPDESRFMKSLLPGGSMAKYFSANEIDVVRQWIAAVSPIPNIRANSPAFALSPVGVNITSNAIFAFKL